MHSLCTLLVGFSVIFGKIFKVTYNRQLFFSCLPRVFPAQIDISSKLFGRNQVSNRIPSSSFDSNALKRY
jgi:hypothetical protein